jgi:hypothetical protein
VRVLAQKYPMTLQDAVILVVVAAVAAAVAVVLIAVFLPLVG